MGSDSNEQGRKPPSKPPVSPGSGASPSGPLVRTPEVVHEAVAGQKRTESHPGPSDPGAARNPAASQGTRVASAAGNQLRKAFGALLFVCWVILTVVWLASTVYSVVHGNPMAALTAFGALALLLLLGAMEGLEVAVIDQWDKLWPGRSTAYLARWLAARQLFVASIVTAATLLANRAVLVVPWTEVQTTDAFVLGIFDLAWTTFTVLWFAQIMPKHLGAMNPHRYIHHLHRTLFPVVEVVRKVGVSLPGEWTAYVLEYHLAWPAKSRDEADQMIKKHSLAGIWSELQKDVHEEEAE